MKGEVGTEEQVEGKSRILIAEDEMIIAADLERMLTGLGYDSAGIFMSGEEILQGIDEARPDLVLMDIRLRGELDGIEVAAQIREQYDIPVVYLTGYAEEAVLQEAKLTGPFGYVGKPVRERELRATIEMALYRHRMERKLGKSEERFRCIYWQSPVGIELYDPEGNLIDVNPACLELFGIDSVNQVRGFQLFEDPNLPVEAKNLLEKGEAVQYESVFDFELVRERSLYKTSRSGRCFVDCLITPIQGSGGFPGGFLVHVRDITERKQAEEELRESEARYRTLVNESVQGFVVYQNGRYVFVSPAFTDLIGYSVDELQSLSQAEALHLVHLDDRQEIFQRYGDRMAGSALSPSHEFRFIHRNGTVIWVEAHSSHIDYGGQPAVQLLTVDVTERKRAQVTLQQRTHELGERLKELCCLYGISGLAEKQDISLEEILQEIVDLIPPAWQYPEVTCARILLDRQQCRTENFREALWKQASDIIVGGERVGAVEVCYLEERPESYEGPFLEEERRLINAIAERMGKIIERKQAEEALRESEERFRLLAETSPDYVYQIDTEGTIIYASSAVEQILGYKPQELIGKSFLMTVPPDVHADTMNRFQIGLSQITTGVFENIHVKKDGEVVYIETHATSMTKDGKVVGLQGISHDISERKLAEEALRESEQQLKEAQAMGRIGNWEFDLESQEVRWSEQTYELYERDRALGPPSDEEEASYYSPEQTGMLREYARRAIEEGNEFEYDLQAELPSGKVARFAATMRPVKDESGRTVRLFGTVQDITERKQAEEQIKASLAEKEVLLQEIHHRVKNNLQVISSLLRLQSDALESEEAVHAFRESKNRIQAMANVHEHLYRSDDLAQIDMANYIKQMVSYLRQSSLAYSVIAKVGVADVALDVDTAIPCGLLINELVSNAMKHAFPAQEEAGPDAPRGEILVALRAEGDELELTVSDDGVGLPEDVDMETATSLGLRLVEMLARQLQGRLEVDRGEEGGTCFRITFPAPR